MISILIPTFNDNCVNLVETLSFQAATMRLREWEIVVADDASTDRQCVTANQVIATLPNCRLVRQKNNLGRAGIRNLLARLARGTWLLYIDADLTVIDSKYLERYVNFAFEHPFECICCGGYKAMPGPQGNLRWMYEQRTAKAQTASYRRQQKYQSFKLSNTLLSKSIFSICKLDESMRQYGYEDVMLGKQLQNQSVPIYHIDNPLGFCHYESNANYLAKTEEALDTLCQHQNDLQGYSKLLALAIKIRKSHASRLLLWLCKLAIPICKRNLLTKKPKFILFRVYQIGILLLNRNW